MRKLALLLLLPLALAVAAAEPPPPPGSVIPVPPDRLPATETVRELYVPFDELNVLLESGPRRVLLSREEYEDLAKRAKKTAADRAPQQALLAAADYQITLADERARIAGTLSVSVLEDGLSTVPLELGSVGLISAELDGKGAAIGRADDGRWLLFVEGKGSHELKLDMVAPVETTAARQILRIQVPTPPASRMILTTPGDVELKSGAAVVSRNYDATAGRTVLSLLPPRGLMTLVLSLNSHLRSQGRLVVARSVVLDEVTRAYERLHATISMAVLHSAVGSFTFTVPDGFEITEVTSPYLSRWALRAVRADREGEAGRVLEVTLSEDTTETVVVSITGIRTSPDLSTWRFPRIEPQDVVGHMSVVGLVLEDRLKAEGIATEGLLPIDVAVLTPTLPASATGATREGVLTRPVVAYYAPHAAYSLTARFVKPPAEVSVTTNVLLTLSDRGHDVRAAFAVLPQEEKLFAVDITVPAGWQVSAVTGDGDAPLPFERYTSPAPTPAGQAAPGAAPPAGAGRIHVRFPQGVAVGTEAHVTLAASRVPADWLNDWTTTQIALPEFAVSGATRDIGAVAVEARDDMIVRPDEITNLTRLAKNEMAQYGLAGLSAMAYRYDARPYAATFAVERVAPRMTARTFSFFRVERDTLVAHCELEYEITAARARKLVLELPKDTPEKLSIRGLGGTTVKEFNPEVVGNVRRWTAHLTDRSGGTVRLAVDFEQRREGLEHKGLALPIVRAAGVDYQSGLVSVEGDAELDIRIAADTLRKVDVGELVDAEYQPGRRLLGVWSFVGAEPAITLDVARRDPYALPSAIAQQAELRTVIGENGLSLNDVRFTLKTKAQYLKILLPERAEFWSATLDGQPTKPERDGRSLLVSLGDAGEARPRTLQVVYSAAVGDLGLWTRRSIDAPRLSVHTGPGSPGVRVPVVDLVWHVHLPTGHRVVRSEGSVVTDQVTTPPLAMATLPGRVLAFGGGAGLDRGALGFLDLLLPKFVMKSAEIDSKTADYEFEAGTMSEGGGSGGGGHRSGGRVSEGKPSSDMTYDDADKELSKLREDSRPDYKLSAEEMRLKFLDKLERSENERRAETPKGEPAAELEANRPATPAPVLSTETTVTVHDARPVNVMGGIALPVTVKQPARRTDLNRWSLVMAIEPSAELGPEVTFSNLGEDPVLDVVTVNTRRAKALAWALAGAVLLAGLAKTRRSAGHKAVYVLLVAFVATLIPVLSGCMELALITNPAFNAACLLIPYYLVAGLVRWIVRLVRERQARRGTPPTSPAVTVALLLMAILGALAMAAPAAAQESRPAPYVIQVVDPSPPVRVPDAAIVVPYDGDALPAGAAKTDRLLVSYDRFVELWNLANPQKKIGAEKPVANYALAGAAFKATLAGDEFLLLEGHLDLDVYIDGYAEVPLALAGGVLAKADLDGKPARLGLPQIIPMLNSAPNAPVAQQEAQQARPQQGKGVGPVIFPTPNVLVAYVSGKGRHRLDLAVRLKLERRGGWRVAEGQLPAAGATSLELTVPEAATEVRLTGFQDRPTHETKQSGEIIVTALVAGSPFTIQWRPKVGESQVDRGLAVESAAVVEVREDRLGVAWQMTFSFPRGQREVFTVTVPEGYIVERIDGPNVRGWQTSQADSRTQVTVSLLKPAKDSDQITVTLWRSESFAAAAARQITLPLVEVAEAVRHSGTITIRRSPLLDLRLASSEGVSRVDLAGGAATRSEAPSGDNPLGLRDWQSYRFAAAPFKITLDVEPLAAWAEATTESLLKIAERLRTLETRVVMHIKQQPLYRVEMLIPSDLKVESVLAPGEFEWAVRAVPKTAIRPFDCQELTIYLAAGQTGDVPIVIRGKLGDTRPVEAVAVPRIEVQGVRRQTGELVVQVDPAFDVQLDPAATQNLESIPLGRTWSWLAEAQRSLARLALSYKRPDVAGRLVITRRTPTIACYTVSNVRVTDRSLVETILLAFQVERAGLGEIVFRLPESMKAARISVPGLRLKTVEPPQAGWVTVHLELEDEVIGQIRVLIENDRLLSSEVHEAPIPVVLTGTTEQRYVALESAGRDEVEVVAKEGVESLQRQMREYERVAGLLSGGTTQAYLVAPGVEKPRLAFRTRPRALVEIVAARIGLARTTLIVDAGGAYRGQVVYRVDNRTEQYLEIALPEGAELWTARVDGAPVKPVDPPAGAPKGRLLVPIVKTADGDLDYQVVLVYAGKMTEPGRLATVRFPLVRTVNIPVELSQVELLLPEDITWLDFGGTMTRAEQAGDIEAGVVDYWNRQQRRLLDAISSSNPFAQARARSNLNLSQEELQKYRRTYGAYEDFRNDKLDLNLKSNDDLQHEAARQLAELDKREQEAAVVDNSGNMWRSYNDQRNNRATNIVQDSGTNFSGTVAQPGGQQAGDGKFSAGWLEQNKLAAQPEKNAGLKAKENVTGDAYSSQSWEGRQQTKRSFTERQPQAARFSKGKADVAQPSDELQSQADNMQLESGGKDQRALALRYQQRLQQQGQAQPSARPADMPGTVTGPQSTLKPAEGSAQTTTAAGEDRERGLSYRLTTAFTEADAGRTGHGDVYESVSFQDTGLASLTEVELPRPSRGYRTYQFTTPQGDVAITARAVSGRTVDSAKRLGLLVLAVVAAWWIGRLVRRRSWSGIAPRLASTLLVVLGAAGMLFGVTPLFALAALVAGIVWKVSLRLRRRAQTRAAA